MAQMNPRADMNSVEQAIDRWIAKEQGYVRRFGQEVLKDRDFMKAKLDALKRIHSQFGAGGPLSFEERIDLRVLKGQVRQLNRIIFRNPLVRVLRNLFGLMVSILTISLRTAAAFVNQIIRLARINSNNYVLTRHIRAGENEIAGQKTGQGKSFDKGRGREPAGKPKPDLVSDVDSANRIIERKPSTRRQQTGENTPTNVIKM